MGFVRSILLSRVGKYIHPFFMTLISIGWFSTWMLGILARKARVAPAMKESDPLLRSGLHGLREAKYHHKLSALLFFLTVFFSMLAMLYNYLAAGKLYPGRHLFGGLSFILIVSFNVAAVPFLGMNDAVRAVHATVGLLAIGFLLNQIISGMGMVRQMLGTR